MHCGLRQGGEQWNSYHVCLLLELVKSFLWIPEKKNPFQQSRWNPTTIPLLVQPVWVASTFMTCFALGRKSKVFCSANCFVLCFCATVKTIFIAVYSRLHFKASFIWARMVSLLAVAKPHVSLHHYIWAFSARRRSGGVAIFIRCLLFLRVSLTNVCDITALW